jgi:translation elongation factor P/translation initiation factor 5A
VFIDPSGELLYRQYSASPHGQGIVHERDSAMVLASEIKEGAAIELDGKPYKVLEVVRHAGSGQMHGFIEVKHKDIRFGHFADRRFKQTDKIETAELSKNQMNFL